MNKNENKLNFLAGLVSVWFLFSHLIAEKLSLYWVFAWYDIYMHFLGGIFLGFIYLVYLLNLKLVKKYPIFFLLFFLIIVGVGWEVFEFAIDYYLGMDLQPSVRDTLADLCFDVAGGILVYLLYLIDDKFKYEKTSN